MYAGKKPKFLQLRTAELAIAMTTVTTAGAINNAAVVDTSAIRYTLATSITGFVAPVAPIASGKSVVIANANTVDLTIVHQSASSTAANRLDLGGVDVILATGMAIEICYDDTTARWRAKGAAGPYVVTLTGTQVLTNKDIDGGTATNTRRITLPKETTTNLNALTRKAGTVVYDTTSASFKGDNGTSLVEFSAVTGLVPTNQSYGNLIINGNFDFWQRGTSATGLGSGSAFRADRFSYSAGTTTGVHTMSQSNSAPTASANTPQSQFSLLLTATTGQATYSGNDYVSITHYLEGYDYQNIHSRTVRLQFWVKGSVTGTYSICFQEGQSPIDSYVTTYSISAANTWERKTIDLTMSTDGGYVFDHRCAIILYFVAAAGASRQTSSLNTWNANARFAANTQVNGLPSNGSTFQIAQVMLIPNDYSAVPSLVIPFQRAGKNIQAELALCQRYYEKSYDLGTDAGGATATGAVRCAVVNAVSGQVYASAPYKVSKRTTPGASQIYSTTDGATGQVFASVNGAARANYTVNSSSAAQNNIEIQLNGFTSSADHGDIWWHWVADAEF